MYELAQIYTQRARTAYGTARYADLSDRAYAYIELIAKQHERFKANLIRQLEEPVFFSRPIDKGIPQDIENAFFKERSRHNSESIYEELSEKDQQSFLDYMKKSLRRLVDLVSGLDCYYNALYLTESRAIPMDDDIISQWADIESTVLSIDHNLIHVMQYARQFGDKHKFIFILQLFQVILALVTEHHPSYAFHYLPGFSAEVEKIEADKLITMLSILVPLDVGYCRQPLNFNNAVDTIQSLCASQPDLMSHIYQNITQYRKQYPTGLPWLFIFGFIVNDNKERVVLPLESLSFEKLKSVYDSIKVNFSEAEQLSKLSKFAYYILLKIKDIAPDRAKFPELIAEITEKYQLYHGSSYSLMYVSPSNSQENVEGAPSPLNDEMRPRSASLERG